MTHLLVVLRWLKLLRHDATEHLQHSLAICLGKNFPQAMQAYLLTPRRFRRKRVGCWLRRMVPLLESCYDKLDTSPRALDAPVFVPLTVLPAAGEVMFEVVLHHGRSVRVPVGFDAATLRQLLAILEEAPSC